MTLKTIGVYFLTGGTGPGSYYYPVMMQFVFVAPLIFCVIKKYEEKGVVLSFVANLFYEVLQRAYGMNEQCYRLLLFRYTFLIAFGCYLHLTEINSRDGILCIPSRNRISNINSIYSIQCENHNILDKNVMYFSSVYHSHIFHYDKISKTRVLCKAH